jgi:hypothetical protein
VVAERFALAVPLFWEKDTKKRTRSSITGDTPLLIVEGTTSAVVVLSRRWSGGGKAWVRDVLSQLEDARFELVQQRPLPSAGDDAILVEHRRWDTGRQTQWHDWRVLVAAGGLGFQVTCRVDENDLRTLGQVCTAIAESFVAAP